VDLNKNMKKNLSDFAATLTLTNLEWVGLFPFDVVGPQLQLLPFFRSS
jgi:hypothetical protein